MTIIFPHIPKTAGTTLLNHFRKNWGKEHVIVHGPYNRATRFFRGDYQLEEMGQDSLIDARVIQGHGVDESLFHYIPENSIQLMVVFRHPVGHSRSRFNHKRSVLKKRGVDLSSDRFMKTEKFNTCSNALCTKFPSFIDDKAGTLLEKAQSVLSKFDYVFTTESLDQQFSGLAETMNLPSKLEKRRVASKKDVLETSDANLAEINHVDLAIFEQANKVSISENAHNALGFDAKGKALAIKKTQHFIANNRKSEEIQEIQEIQEIVYTDILMSINRRNKMDKLDRMIKKKNELPVLHPEKFVKLRDKTKF